jgi:pilus assembly protein CpaB
MNATVRLVIVLLVALGAAGAASFAVFHVITNMPVREVEVGTTDAVVAARPIPVGTLLTKDDVKTVSWPAKSPVPGAFTSVDTVVNRGAVVPMAENEPVTESKLAASGIGGGLPPTIPDGMRAISVKTNEVIGVAGFVVPGTRVDVVVTVRSAAGRDSTSRVVVSNVQVLTAGTKYDQEKAKEEGKPMQATVVTLLVTPQDAEKIALATNEGQVVLALRNPLDVAPTETVGIHMASLLAAPTPTPAPAPRPVVVRRIARVEAPPPPPPAPAPKVYTVEAIRGAKRTEEPVR